MKKKRKKSTMFPLFEGQNSDQSESELQNIFIPFASEVSTP